MALDGTTRRDLETFVIDWLRDDGVPGASLAVLYDGEPVYAEGFGSRDLGTNAPATAETLYGVGSVTKSFTALAVMRLAERGDLDVNDHVADHLDVPFEGITIHDLLTHSSGLPSLGVSNVLIARLSGIRELGVPLGDRDDLLAHVRGAEDEIAAPPGERFFYCNAGYQLLGLIVEERAGRPFDAYVQEEILRPLGMDRAVFRRGEFEADPDRMTPHLLDDGVAEAAPLPFRELSYPAGGLITSVTELASYLRMQMGHGIDGERPVSGESLDRMHAGHVDTPEGAYGYGWRRRELLGRTLTGHAGSIAVSSAYAGFTDDGEYGIALAANASPDYSLASIGEGVLAVLLGEPPEALPFFARRERFARLEGTYESYRGIATAAVERRGGILELSFEGGLGAGPVALVPTDDRIDGYRFYAPAADGTRRPVEFDVTGDGIDCYFDRWRLHKVG